MGWEDVTPQKRQGVINKTLHSYIIFCICQQIQKMMYYHLHINGQRESLVNVLLYFWLGVVMINYLLCY